MKKKLGIISLLVLFSSSLAFAYLTSTTSKTNEFSVGINTTAIVEEFPENELEAGDSIQKVVTIQNKESVPCYIRVMVHYSDNQYVDQTNLDINTKDYQLIGDYYYYQGIVEVGKSTTPLFTTVTSNSNYDGGNFYIYVYEESVQSEGFTSAQEAFEAIGGLYE